MFIFYIPAFCGFGRLENAVKYASGEDTHISVSVSPKTEKISVQVVNIATPEAIENLKKVYAKIIQGNSLDAYVSQMKEAALRSDGKSQLGLSRIRYETGGDLKMEIEKNVVKVSIDIG
jgi:hypothetical protein